MRIVNEIVIKGSSGGAKKVEVKRKRKNGIVRSSADEAKIKSLFRENKLLFDMAKNRGYSLEGEKRRHREIKEELIELKAI